MNTYFVKFKEYNKSDYEQCTDACEIVTMINPPANVEQVEDEVIRKFYNGKMSHDLIFIESISKL